MPRHTDRRMNPLAKILAESSISYASSLVGILANYALLSILTRVLQPAEFGVYALLLSIAELAGAVLLIGLPQAVERYVAYYGALGRPEKVKGLIAQSLCFSLIAGAGGFAVLAVGSRLLAGYVLHSPAYTPAVLLFSASLPATLALRTSLAVLVGYKLVRYREAVHRVLVPAAKLAAAAAILVLSGGLLVWLGAYVAVTVLGFAAALLLLRRLVWRRLASVTSDRKPDWAVLRFGWPLALTQLCSLFAKDLSVILLGRWHSVAEAGVLRIYLQVASLLALALAALSRIHKAVITELFARGDVDAARATHQRVSKWGFVVGVFVAGLLVLLGEELVALLFTPEYSQSFNALLILSIGALVQLAAGPSDPVLQAIGRPRRSLVSALIGVGALLVSGLLLMPRFGILGAAGAVTLSWSLWSGASAVQAYLLKSFQPLTWAHVRCAFAGAASVVALRFTGRWLPLHGVGAIVIIGLSFTAIYWGIALLWGIIDSVDRKLFLAVFARGRVVK